MPGVFRDRLRLPAVGGFAVAAFIAVALAGCAMAAAMHVVARERMLRAARGDAEAVAAPILGRLTAADLAGPLPSDRAATIDRTVHAALAGHTARVILSNAGGVIVYSSDGADIGQTAPPSHARDEAVAGMAAATRLPASASGDTRTDGLLDVYLPVAVPLADARGVLQLAGFDAPGAREWAGAEREIRFALAGALALLYAALVAFVHRGIRRMESRYRDQEGAFAILEATTDLVGRAAADGMLLCLNRSGRRLLGLGDDDDVTSHRIGEYYAEWAQTVLTDDAFPTAERDGAWSGESALVSGDGREVPVSQVILAHKTAAGAVRFFSITARDMSERKHFEARLIHLASHDPLTGLFNRHRFTEEVQRELAESRRYGTHGALLFLDLDGFKGINDRYGHQVGDALLVNLATLLHKRLRETDILTRLGGDEFAILLPRTDAAQAQAIAARLLEETRYDAMVVAGQPIRATTSIGMAIFPEHGTTVEDLLVHADRAMYQAKRDGRDTVRVFDPERDTRAAATAHRGWESRIRQALTEDLFVLNAQPILDLRTDRISQYEVLLRLAGDDGEVVPPGAFLSVAERSGLIHEIDRWVARHAIQLIAERGQKGEKLHLEVNLSAKAFADAELLPLIQYEMMRTHIDPSCLTWEITETAAIADMHQAQEFISTLRRWGCKFAIDDFGVGFASFAYLKHLAVDYVKIDGSFIRNLPHDTTDQHLVRAMVEVARGVGKQTIAEFVSDDETVRLLREYGVDYAQGYHVGRPAPLDEILAQSHPTPIRRVA